MILVILMLIILIIFCQLVDAIDLNKEKIISSDENSFKCSFWSDKDKEIYLNMIEEFK